MKVFDSLQICFAPSKETFDAITDILEVVPTKRDSTLLTDEIPSTWNYEIVVETENSFFDFINNFIDILENKFDRLAEFGIQRNDITIWHLYEYDQQCNMEFDPIRLKRLADNGITLCISCWDSGHE